MRKYARTRQMNESITVTFCSFTDNELFVYTSNGSRYRTTFDNLRIAFKDIPHNKIRRILNEAFATTQCATTAECATMAQVLASSLSYVCKKSGANDLLCTIKDSHIATVLPQEGITFDMQHTISSLSVRIDDINDNNQQSFTQTDSVTNGKIVSCTVNDTLLNSPHLKHFWKVLEYICSKLPTEEVGLTVIKTVSDVMNVRTVEINTKGYKWYPDWGISMQRLDANRTLHVIRKLCRSQNWRLQIQLEVPVST